MSDEVEKRVVITLKGKDDGALGLMDRTIGKSEQLEKRLKEVGKISGLGGLSQIGDAFGSTAKLGGFIGKGGLALGGLAVAGQIGKEMSSLAGGIDRATAAIEKFDGNYSRAAAELARSVPFLGNVVKGWDDLRASGENFIAHIGEQSPVIQTAIDGTNALREAVKSLTAGYIDLGKIKPKDSIEQLYADAAKSNAKVDADRAVTNRIRGLIAGGEKITNLSPSERVRQLEANRDKELAGIDDARRQSFISPEQQAEAKRIITANAEREISKIKQDEADRRIKVETAEADKTLAIQKRTADLVTQLQISSAEKAGNTVQAALLKLRSETSEQIDEIEQQLRDAGLDKSLTPDQRAQRVKALETLRDTVKTTAGVQEQQIRGSANAETSSKAKEASDRAQQEERDRRIRSIESQQGERTRNFDARGQTGFFNQSKQVEDYSRKTADGIEKQNQLTQQLIEVMKQQQQLQHFGAISL